MIQLNRTYHLRRTEHELVPGVVRGHAWRFFPTNARLAVMFVRSGPLRIGREKHEETGFERARAPVPGPSDQMLGVPWLDYQLIGSYTRTFQQVVFGHLLTSKRLFIDTSWKVLVQSLTVYV